jgi:sugar phosphate isomerase/epimerase
MSFGRMSIVLSTHATQFKAVAFKGELEANLAKIASWGYEGVELAIRDPTLVDLTRLEGILSGLGLQVPAIGTGQAWSEEHLSFTNPDLATRKAAVERIKNQIGLASQLKALVIIGLIRGITPAGQSAKQSMGYLIESLQECSSFADQMQVRMAFEPLNRYETDLIHSVDDGLQLLEKVGASNLGLLLDTFHMNIEEADIYESIIKAGRSIFHFHVADSNRRYPGGGHLDFTAILATLKSSGYSGWISGEFLALPDTDSAAKCGIEHLRQCLRHSSGAAPG